MAQLSYLAKYRQTAKLKCSHMLSRCKKEAMDTMFLILALEFMMMEKKCSHRKKTMMMMTMMMESMLV